MLAGFGGLLAAAPGLGQGRCEDKSVSAAAVRTREDIRAFVLCAAEYLREHGVAEAYRAFHEDERWRSGPIYVFADTPVDGGRDVLSLLFPTNEPQEGQRFGPFIDGFGSDYFQEIVRIMDNFGGGWIYYSFRNPATGRDEPKLSYLVEVDWNGTRAELGAGIYLRDLPGTCDSADVNAALLAAEPNPDRLQEFVRCAAFVVERKGYFAAAELGNAPRWRAGPVYAFGLDETGTQFFTGNPVRTNGEDLPEWGDARDPAGPFGGRDVVSVAKAFGETFLYYDAFNPASGRIQRKVAFVRRAMAQGKPVLIGSGYYLPDAAGP